MSRIETFVAAAFAFATSMLVISLGSIPSNMNEFILAVKNVPSFLASCTIILWIWHCHAHWSRWYGLEDAKTIWLSGALICVVLVYIYPLRLMMQGLFASLSMGYFPFELKIEEYWELRFVFIFYASGFSVLSINFLALYAYANKQKDHLQLSAFERLETDIHIHHWYMNLTICLITLLCTIFISDNYLLISPYLYSLFFPGNIWFAWYRRKRYSEANA